MARGYQQLKSVAQDEPDHELARASNRITSHRLGVAFIIILVLASLTAIQVKPFTAGPDIDFETLADGLGEEDIKICVSNIPPAAHPPAPINPWASLSIDEMVEIRSWLLSPLRNLNLTRGDATHPSDNSIYMIQTYYPPKTDVLQYFSSLDPQDAPARFARVTIHHGAAMEPVIRDYLVGPLPVTPTTEITHLTEIYHTETLPYNARGYDALDWNVPEIYTKIAAPLFDAYKASRSFFLSGLVLFILLSGTSGWFTERYPCCRRHWALQFRWIV